MLAFSSNENDDAYYDANDGEEETQGVIVTAPMLSNAFLSFFGNDDNHDDAEENPLPIDDGSTVRHTVVSGGPVEPNYAGMTVAAATMAREQYVKERK